jgi:hypothetical protein
MHKSDHFRRFLTAEISALISANVIFEVPFSCETADIFRIAAIASAEVGTVFRFRSVVVLCF